MFMISAVVSSYSHAHADSLPRFPEDGRRKKGEAPLAQLTISHVDAVLPHAHASIGNNDIDLPYVFRNLLDDVVDDIALLAWTVVNVDWDAELFGDGGSGRGRVGRVVGDYDRCAAFSKSAGDCESNTSSSA